MPNDPTATGYGPWRLLVLDRDPTDPKWILATVATPSDVQPAWPGGTVDEDTAAWVASAAGLYRPVLTSLIRPDVWRIDGQPQEN